MEKNACEIATVSASNSFVHHINAKQSFSDYLAHRLLESSVPLHMEKYTSLPHVFPLVLAHHPCANRAYGSMGGFIRHHLSVEPTNYDYKKIAVHPRTFAEMKLDESSLSLGGLKLGELLERMKVEVKKREQLLKNVLLDGKAATVGDAEGAAKAPELARL